MCIKTMIDTKSEAFFEHVGPIALKAIALLACLAIFAPLVAAFAAPFVG